VIVLRAVMFGIRRNVRELRELHLGTPRPAPDAPRASEQLAVAYEAAMAGELFLHQGMQVKAHIPGGPPHGMCSFVCIP
jgi:hypothetical protein